MITRRGFAAGLPLLLSGTASASRTPPKDLRALDLDFDTKTPFVERALVLVPTHLKEGEKAPVLVLFHGLGEAKEGPESGVFAWLDRYGLGGAYARLRDPPVHSILKREDLSKQRAKDISGELELRPFGGMVVVCPFTPNVWSFKSTTGTLDVLTRFVVGSLMERVGKEVKEADTTRVGIDGCSLGGFVALEVLAREKTRFRSFGVVQPAIGEGSVPKYATLMAEAHASASSTELSLITSTHDPYLRVTKLLSEQLLVADAGHALKIPKGPHDQPFLRDVGTLEMLLFHDRALRRGG